MFDQCQIVFQGRDATPQPLTEFDLVDIEEKYDEDDKKKRTDSLWDALVKEVTRKKFSSFIDPSVYYRIPDMDDMTAEVKVVVYLDSNHLLKNF